MEVEPIVGMGKQKAVDMGGHHLCRRAVWITWEGAVEISRLARLDRGSASARAGSWKVGRRQGNQASSDILGSQLEAKLRERNLAFIFVAVVAGSEQYPRPFAIPNADDR